MNEFRRQVDDIAVIGMAGRFPGANDVEGYWRNLVGGVESITFLTEEELLANPAVDPDEIRSPNYVRAAAVIDDMEWFDAGFFGMTPREAEIRDPQHRLFLECVHTALEHAGYDPSRAGLAIGVFGGMSSNRYAWQHVRKNDAVNDAMGSIAVETSNNADYLSTFVSYKLDLTGPSFTVSTACSTSLVAIHLACQSLQNGECDMAVAGGVEVEFPPRTGYLAPDGGIYSPDGHTRAFDAGAGGTFFGSGAGVVVLKRLEAAIADGDHVHALIKGTAINNDGTRKAGFTAPSAEGQARVIAEAYGVAGVDVETVGYVEAHGTGTNLGDPIEVEALSRVFRASTDARGFCGIGSVKSNIAHLGPASGVAGLIKAVLALERGLLPPTLHFERPNPKIDFAGSPFYVVDTLQEWPRGARPRRAGVSSFGMGGTNAHAVLEEAPAIEPSGPSRSWQLLTLSARTPTALETATEQLAGHLAAHPDASLADVGYTLQVGRTPQRHRRTVLCETVEGAVEALSTLDARRVATSVQEPRDRPVAFLFPGQGAQHPDMGLELYRAEPVFRDELDRCARLLRPALGLDLREVLYPEPDRAGEAAERLAQTWITQPALFTVEYALARLLMEAGVEPAAMIGHSVGEYVAACLAGVFSLEDALALVAARGRIVQDLPPGAMLAVPLPEAETAGLLGDGLALAAVNAPSLCVVSGPAEAIDELEERLRRRELAVQRLRTSHAFHSAMMDPAVAALAARVAQVPLAAPVVPFVSNVTGTWIAPERAADPAYWGEHLRRTVRFMDGAAELLADPDRVLLEVGPGTTLAGLVRHQLAPGSGSLVISAMRHPQKRDPDCAVLLSALGRLWLAGVTVDWESRSSCERRHRVVLPTYPFERKRHWVDPAEPARPRERRQAGRLGIDACYFVPAWRESPRAVLESYPPPQPSPSGGEGDGVWLVFADGQGLGALLAARLEQRNETVVSALPGTRFGKLRAGVYQLAPAAAADYDALLQAVAADVGPPARIVHCWSVTGAADPDDVETARRLQETGFTSLLFLAQAIARSSPAAGVRLDVVSNGVQDVLGGEPLVPAKTTVLGPVRNFEKEVENLRCRSLDVVLSGPAGMADGALADQVLAELLREPGEREVALRGRKRWTLGYAPTRLPAPAGPAPLRQRGVYLVTGGLGGIGLTLAEHLARQAAARLVLLTRSRDRTSRQVERLREIEALGAEVLVLSADVADPAQMRAALDQARARFGPIDGVVHAAGVPGGGMVAVKPAEVAAGVLAPKVDGSLVLASLLPVGELDFFVLCSSIVAVAGDFGLMDYCAANCFLDAFAHRHAGRAVSIDWAAWLEVGMAAEAARTPAAFRELQSGLRFEPCRHPLLDRRILDASDDLVYATELTATSHWVLREHRLGQHAVLPGTAYVELVRAAFEDGADQHVEIRDLLFLAPLRIGPEDRVEVRAIVRPGAGGAGFRVVASTTPQAHAPDEWPEYARGSLRRVEAGPAPRHDLDALRGRCDLREVVFREGENRGLVEVGPRWANLERIHVGEGEELAELRLPPEFRDDLAEYVLHPALLDGATAFAQTLLPPGSYLPFGYGRVTVRGPLPERIWSHVRHRDAGDGSEFATCDIAIMDETGRELVAIEGFTMRRVDGAAVLASLARSPSAPEGDGRGGAAAVLARGEVRGAREEVSAELQFGLTPAEGAEAFARILAAHPGPQVVVCPEGLERKIERTAGVNQRSIREELAGLQLAAAVQSERTLANAYVAPEGELERTLVDLWQLALGVTPVGVEDDLFELGGNSLVAVQLATRIRELFQIDIALPTLFEQPTVRGLALVVEGALIDRAEGLSDAEAERLVVAE